MSSIRLRLLKWLVAPILVFNLLAASLTYLLAWTPAQRAFDQKPERREWVFAYTPDDKPGDQKGSEDV